MCSQNRLFRDPILLVFFFTLIEIPFLLCSQNEPFGFIIYRLVASYLQSFIFWFLCNCFKGTLELALKSVVLFVLVFLFSLNCFVVNRFETVINSRFISIILSTNVREASEFCSAYLNTQWYVFIGIIPFVILFFYYSLRNRLIIPKQSFAFLLLSLLSYPILFVYSPTLMSQMMFGELFFFFQKDYIDLSKHKTNLGLIEIQSDHPQKIVIILGESFAKSHSSLYGYSKETNPFLSQLQISGNLIVFNDVLSPAENTNDAFKQILSCYDSSVNPHKYQWYESPSVLEALISVNYRTHWVSNQEMGTPDDVVPTMFANLCEDQFFNWASSQWRYDEFLLKHIFTENQNDGVFYHMLGQHPIYSKRFPSSQVYFVPEDYLELPEHQRQIVADYDNATRYNDLIVGNLMLAYQNTDAIVFYMPDHGQDIYVTDSSKYGHGRMGNHLSVLEGEKIPFMVYLTPEFIQLHAESFKYLQAIKDHSLNTSNFFYLLLHAIGYDLSEDDAI